ncbi:MAG: LysM peptidoglycan-binding domain-containing protein [Caulobacter sp.]
MDYDREGAKKGLMTGLMGLLRAKDREPGPATLYEVDISARRRWKDLPGNLKGGKPYRPRTLARVAAALDALKPEDLGLALIETKAEPGSFDLYEVVPGDTLGKIASKAYGDAKLYPLIMAANAHQIVDPNRIHAGRVLRIPHRAPG